MKYKPTGNPNGRPRAEIDKKVFEGLCSIQCTEVEVCSVFGVDEVTLNRWCKENYDGMTFSQIYAEKKNCGKTSLRRKQWLMADKNATMAIWLGKQYLGQSDKVEAINDNTNKNIEVKIESVNEEDMARVQALKEKLFNGD